MRRLLLLILLVTFGGCTSIVLPSYVSDKNPYKKRFYGDYVAVVEAAKKALDKFGWSVTEEPDPGIYEHRWEMNDPNVHHILLFTKYKESYYGLGTKNVVLNAYIRAGVNEATEVELRYLKVSTVSYKSFYDYKNDKLIEQIFKEIEKNLQN